MEPYKRRDAEKLYNELLQQVQQQIISYRESTKNKLSRIEETIQSLVQEVKGNSVGDRVKEQEEFMNPFASKEWNTRSLSHLQIMFPKLEGAEVIKCSPDSEHQEFTGKPIYDEEPGEDQECWPEKEFILAALSGHNPNSSKRLQPEICTSERPKASEDLSNTQMTQDMNTHSPLQRLKSIRLEEVLSMIPTSRETFEAFLSKGIVKYFIAALIPHNLSITSSEFGNGNILNFDPGGQKENEQTKGVMACVTTEEKDLYYLLEHSFHPLDLASQVQPLLIKISKLGAKLSSVSSIPEVQLSQYISSFEKLTTLRLLQQISQEFDDNNCFEGYWLLNNSPGPVVEHGFCEKESTTPLMSQLKSNGMVRWGIRRQVKILNSHGDNSTGHRQSSASFVRGSKEKLQSDEDNVAEKHEQEGEEEDNDAYDEDKEEEEIENELYEETVKRKSYSLGENARKAKKVKRSKQKQVYKEKTRNKCKKMIEGHSINRWSAERYKLAERNLLEVMKAKGAVFNSPILRPELRLEARKRIGDTGLLDHLLKHVSGKLAPGGAERFGRRDNADGAMEYWLESADLVRVRKEAGVQDPYWTPPTGWTPGDCRSQDPTSAKEFRLLKEEKAKIKRDMENMLSKKQLMEELQNLRREINVQFSKMQEEILALKIQSSGAISQNLNIEASLLAPWKSDFDSALVQVNKPTKQLTEISDSLIGMKDEIGKLNSMVGLASKTDRFDKIIREINQQYADSVKTWMIVLPYKYRSRCIDLRQGSPGKVMRFEIHDAWRRKYTITIFDPGGRKWSHEINHEDMVVFQGGRIVRNALEKIYMWRDTCKGLIIWCSCCHVSCKRCDQGVLI